jgi:hypothetical protein
MKVGRVALACITGVMLLPVTAAIGVFGAASDPCLASGEYVNPTP